MIVVFLREHSLTKMGLKVQFMGFLWGRKEKSGMYIQYLIFSGYPKRLGSVSPDSSTDGKSDCFGCIGASENKRELRVLENLQYCRQTPGKASDYKLLKKESANPTN